MADRRSRGQLPDHEGIRQRFTSRGRFFECSFRTGRKSVTIDVKGCPVFDEMRAALAAARRGCGLAYVVKQFASGDLNAGSLASVPDRHSPAREAFYLYHANRAQMPRQTTSIHRLFPGGQLEHAEVTPMQDLIANFRLKKVEEIS
jgi:DNA-binding transcriptional LysR family regulator